MIEFTSLASSSAGCAYRVSSPGCKPLLIECGLPYKQLQRGLNFRVSELAGCLISHAHQDHCKAVFDVMRNGINCYAHPQTWHQMDQAKVDNAKPKVKGLLTGIGSYSCVPDWQVMPFDAEHDCPGSVGFLIGNSTDRLLYLTDSCYSAFRFERLTHIALEVNHCEEIMRKNVEAGIIEPERYRRTLATHMSLQRAVALLKANDLSRVERIYLLHLSADNSDAALFEDTIRRATGKPVTVCAA